jgi:hypothetical protein
MLKQLLAGIALICPAFAGSPSSAGGNLGTPQEAKAMLERAVMEVKGDKAAAVERFNRNEPPFRDRDLFVFCFNARDGRFTAHEAFVDWDVRTLRDPDGKAFGVEMYSDAREDQITEIAFAASVPGSTKLAAKRAYVTRVADQICGVSAYQFSSDANLRQ